MCWPLGPMWCQQTPGSVWRSTAASTSSTSGTSGSRTPGSTCVRWGAHIREKEGISTLFPVSDLDTKWYSICAAHSERARYVQWIMRLWHDVTGTKSNTQPENGKGFSMQMNCSKCEMFIFSFPWNWMLNSLIEQSVLLSFHRCGSCSPVDLSTLSQLSDSLNKMR